MPGLLLPTLAKAAIPAVAIGVILFVAKRRRLSFREDLGLRMPLLKPAVLFLFLWGGLVAAEELIAGSAGQAKPWPEYTTGILLLRILAIGLLGPIAEELAFRGVLLGALRRTRLGIYGAIALTAAVWASIHMQYEPATLALIFIDGLVLGAARHYTRSLYVPIFMHVMGNLFSIWQSLGGGGAG
jgi:membrane protease YdiL (CAAX protease family)